MLPQKFTQKMCCQHGKKKLNNQPRKLTEIKIKLKLREKIFIYISWTYYKMDLSHQLKEIYSHCVA